MGDGPGSSVAQCGDKGPWQSFPGCHQGKWYDGRQVSDAALRMEEGRARDAGPHKWRSGEADSPHQLWKEPALLTCGFLPLGPLLDL